MKITDIWQPNQRAISYEDFGDEVVLVALETGVYFSLNQSGTLIWRLIEQQLPLQQILDYLQTRYQLTSEFMTQEILPFLELLESEQFVIAISETASMSPDSQPLDSLIPSDQPFTPPVLERYTDMQNLLLLDPIHEVDETGWPTPLANP